MKNFKPSIEEGTEDALVFRAIAQQYYLDALDFSDRFDLLWKSQTHKTGQIKAFVDLLMACECALKSHVILGEAGGSPKAAYKSIRRAQHDIGKLADLASFSPDRSGYEFIKSSLHGFSVFLRYSLDASHVFFPILHDWQHATIKYSETIGCQPWVLSIRQSLNSLMQKLHPEFTGKVSNDILEILATAHAVERIMGKWQQ